MKRLVIIVLWSCVLLLGITSVAVAAEADAAATNASLLIVLAPLLAAATAIERVIEMIFDLIEASIRRTGSFFGVGRQYFKWARDVAVRYRETVQQAGAAVATVADNDDRRRGVTASLTVAETALGAAEARLDDLLTAPAYLGVKRLVSLALGIVLGLVAANVAEIRMFQMMGVTLGDPVKSPHLVGFLARMDMVITGLVIGTGSAPVHSLIGVLQSTREAVQAGRDLWSGKSKREIEGLIAQLVAQRELAAGGDEVGRRDLGEPAAPPSPEQVRRAARAILR